MKQKALSRLALVVGYTGLRAVGRLLLKREERESGNTVFRTRQGKEDVTRLSRLLLVRALAVMK